MNAGVSIGRQIWLRCPRANQTPVLTILVTLPCDETYTGTFVTMGVMEITADSRPQGNGWS